MALNPKQQRFIEEYILDWNATQAAIRAGYSKKTARQQGTALLSQPSINDAIRQIQTEKRNAAIMEYDEACAILSSIARGRVADYFDDEGRIDRHRIREVNPSAVQSVEHDMHIEGGNETPTYVHTTKFKLHSPIQAIQQLAKMKGWDAPVKQDINVGKSFAEMILEARREEAARAENDG